MQMTAAFAFILALFLSTALVPALGRVAGRLGLIDRPGGRKVHVAAMPRTGGIAIFLGFLAPVLLWVPLRDDLRAFVIAAGVLFCFGVLDDRFNLDYRLKLLGQLLAALIVTLGGGVLITHFPFAPDERLPFVLALPFTLLALVGITNALNLSDGLDGLAGGISLLAIGALLLLAYQAEDAAVVTVALAVMGATFGFLRFNTYPARVFMGDSGSQFLGFSAAVLAVIVTQTANPALSPVVPVLLLGLPILDTLTVMTRRIAAGRSPFAADRTHLHHRLLDLGLSQYEAVAAVYLAQAALVVLAYLLRYSADALLVGVYAAFAVTVLVGLRHLAASAPHLKARPAHASWVGRLVAHVRETALLKRYPFLVLNLAVPLFLVAGALASGPVGTDLGLLAAGLLLVLGAAFLLKSVPFFFLERLTAYATAVSVAYLLDRSGPAVAACRPCLGAFFVFLAGVTAVWVRFSSGAFRVNTLDILVVLLAVAVPSLPGPDFRDLGVVALESIVLFYAIEVLFTERERHWDALRFGVFGALAILAGKGLLF